MIINVHVFKVFFNAALSDCYSGKCESFNRHVTGSSGGLIAENASHLECVLFFHFYCDSCNPKRKFKCLSAHFTMFFVEYDAHYCRISFHFRFNHFNRNALKLWNFHSTHYIKNAFRATQLLLEFPVTKEWQRTQRKKNYVNNKRERGAYKSKKNHNELCSVSVCIFNTQPEICKLDAFSGIWRRNRDFICAYCALFFWSCVGTTKTIYNLP